MRADVVRDAVRAAVEVGDGAGFGAARPAVVQDTNNVVVRLAPHPVVAKVGTWPHSAEVLAVEVDVCTYLSSVGAPVGVPLGPLRVSGSGRPVSLWAELERAPGRPCSDGELAAMLGRVHDGLRGYGGALPGWLGAVDHARATLADDDRMAALPADDLHLLRTSFDTWAARLRDRTTPERPLHGEPHLGNVVVTADGPVLIDFEGASIGPPEWDLASLPPGVADRYGGVDGDRLALARLLDSARVATWGWAYAQHPTMRRHGEHHLAVVRRAHER